MALSNFQLLRPRTLEEALALFERDAAKSLRTIRVLAGGTDLLPSLRQTLFEPQWVIDLRKVEELRGISETEQDVEIGATTTLREIENSKLLQNKYPVLFEAA